MATNSETYFQLNRSSVLLDELLIGLSVQRLAETKIPLENIDRISEWDHVILDRVVSTEDLDEICWRFQSSLAKQRHVHYFLSDRHSYQSGIEIPLVQRADVSFLLKEGTEVIGVLNHVRNLHEFMRVRRESRCEELNEWGELSNRSEERCVAENEPNQTGKNLHAFQCLQDRSFETIECVQGDTVVLHDVDKVLIDSNVLHYIDDQRTAEFRLKTILHQIANLNPTLIHSLNISHFLLPILQFDSNEGIERLHCSPCWHSVSIEWYWSKWW